jgi:hypothetical protein
MIYFPFIHKKKLIYFFFLKKQGKGIFNGLSKKKEYLMGGKTGQTCCISPFNPLFLAGRAELAHGYLFYFFILFRF